MTAPSSKQFLRFPEVSRRVALKKSAIYKRVQEGTFPAPVKLSERCSVWPEDVIDDWMSRQIDGAAHVLAGGEQVMSTRSRQIRASRRAKQAHRNEYAPLREQRGVAKNLESGVSFKADGTSLPERAPSPGLPVPA